MSPADSGIVPQRPDRLNPEDALLAVCVAYPTETHGLVLESGLTPDHFEDRRNREVWAAVCAAPRGETDDLLLCVAKTVRERPGGPELVSRVSALLSMGFEIATAAGAASYPPMLRERLAKRRAKQALDSLSAAAGNGATAAELAGDIGEVLSDLQLQSAPTVRLRDLVLPYDRFMAQEWPTPDSIVPAWLPGSDLVFCQGKPSSSKTFLLLALASAVSAGRSWGGITLGAPRPVIFLELDLRSADVKARLQNITVADGPPGELYLAGLDVLAGQFQLEKNTRDLLDLIQQTKAALLVIDPFGSAHGLNQLDNQEMQQLLWALTPVWAKLGCTVLFGAHPRKGRPDVEDGGPESLLGAARLGQTALVMWRVVEHLDGRHVRVEVDKTNMGARPEPLWFSRNPHGVLLHCDDPGNIAQILASVLLDAMNVAGGRISGDRARDLVLEVEPGLLKGKRLDALTQEERSALRGSVAYRCRKLGWKSEGNRSAVWLDPKFPGLEQGDLLGGAIDDPT